MHCDSSSAQQVHPQITRLGSLPIPGGICPCIDVGTGIVAHNWAADAAYVGRERINVEFIWREMVLDHFVKGPHHVWSDVDTGAIVRLWQPWNGLEVFDPDHYIIGDDAANSTIFDLPKTCELLSKVCIDGTQPSVSSKITALVADALHGDDPL